MVTDFIHFSFVIVEKFKATSLVFFFWGGVGIDTETVSLYSLGCSRTHSSSFASVSQVLGIQA